MPPLPRRLRRAGVVGGGRRPSTGTCCCAARSARPTATSPSANDVAAAYERDLERGRAEIAASLERSDRARMLAELPVLIAALERDLIDAGDFRT